MKLSSILILASFFTTATFAQEDSWFKGEMRSTADFQSKYLTPQYSDSFDKNQSQQHLVYVNTDFKMTFFKHHTIDANWFLRYANSPMYKNGQDTTFWSNFPNKVLARDMFKLEKYDEGTYSQTESTLNQFVYSWGDEEMWFSLGRMFVKYGEGFTFNPINPFNLSTHYSSYQDTDQGNDGLSLSLQATPDLILNLYIFGDKSLTDYNGQFSRTIFVMGDWSVSPKTHIHYIFGEDQRRHNFGFEYKYSFEKGIFFAQGIHQTERVDEKSKSESLNHFLLGYERDLSPSWVSRIEIGRQDLDEKKGYGWKNMSFLPMHHFVSLINQFQMTDKMSLRINFAAEPETQFHYLMTQATYSLGKYLEMHAFYGKTLHLDPEHEKVSTETGIPMELGGGFRFIF